MRPTRPPSFRAQAGFLRRQFLQGGGLPFADVLTEEVLAGALAFAGRWLDRIFSPLVTLRVFLGQVLDPDHSCRAAVARPRRVPSGGGWTPRPTGGGCGGGGGCTCSTGRP